MDFFHKTASWLLQAHVGKGDGGGRIHSLLLLLAGPETSAHPQPEMQAV